MTYSWEVGQEKMLRDEKKKPGPATGKTRKYDYAQLRQMLSDGMTEGEVRKETGCSKDTLRSAIKEAEPKSLIPKRRLPRGKGRW